MRTRALLCPENTINTIGFRNIRSSRRYDVFKIIGTDRIVDLSQYSEIVLLYQYPLNGTDEGFMDFVRKNRDDLKDAVLLFDVPMEVMEEIGIDQSMAHMRRICSEIFNEDVPFIIHDNPNVPVLIDKLSGQLDARVDNNKNWVKESGHVSVLTTYYLQDMGSIPHRSYPPYMIIGILLILIGAVLFILRLLNVIPYESTVLCTVFLLGGISALSAGYLIKTRNYWKK